MKLFWGTLSLAALLCVSGCSNQRNPHPGDGTGTYVEGMYGDSIPGDSVAPKDSIAPKDTVAVDSLPKNIEKIPFSKDSILIQSRGGSPNGCKLLIPPIKVKGIYITGAMAGTKNMKNLVELVETTEMNAIVLDIKNDGGNVTYKMDNAQAQSIGACVRYVKDMPALIKELHEKGIYVIGRIVCFKDPILARKRPDLALCQPDSTPVTDGKGNPWVNPFKKGVWEYICDLAEQATRDGFDEIQFDYVRFPIGSSANKAVYGVDLNTYSKEQGLTDFFSYVEKRLHKSNIIFGADLFGTVIGSPTDRKSTGQDYVKIASMTDNICPMVYPSHYASRTFGLDVPDAHPYTTILKAMQLSQDELAKDSLPKARVRAWLQCFSAPWVPGHINYGSAQVKQQIQAVYDAGYDEWILWNASNRYGQVKAALSMSKAPAESAAKKDSTANTKAKDTTAVPASNASDDKPSVVPAAPQTDSTQQPNN
ncbi:MAG: putative glycoside hydrolase [Paludibacteraceae bacterium]|nr:putative glycoside hydrolase [Paludibacteraceae bacterium]